jgi:O-antigen ligase
MSFPSQVKTIAYFFLVGCLIAGSIFSQAIFARFDAEERLEVISVSERLSGYAQWNEVFLKNPVTGVGVGGYTAALATITPGQSAWAYQPVHNVFLLILSEIGLLGFVAFFWWVISVGKSLRTEAQGFMISLGTCLFFLALFDHYLWSLWPGLALSAFVFAMILRGSRAP